MEKLLVQVGTAGSTLQIVRGSWRFKQALIKKGYLLLLGILAEVGDLDADVREVVGQLKVGQGTAQIVLVHHHCSIAQEISIVSIPLQTINGNIFLQWPNHQK